jgi:hypothetical protein
MPAADLFVECVQELLARCCAGKCGALKQRAAESPPIEIALGRAIERHAQPVHQVDDFRPPIGHFFHRRLMLQKIAAIDRVVEVQPFVVALLPRQVVDAVDAPLGTDTVRPLHRHQAHQVDVDPQLGQLHCRRQPGQTTADDHYSLFCHASMTR